MVKRLSFLMMTLASLLLITNSCVDHDMPSVLPELKTLEVTAPPSRVKCGTYFSVDIVSLGTTAVKEYGVVVSGNGFSATHAVPELNIDYKLMFDLPFVTGIKYKEGPQICVNNIYYRAYAILVDDTVVYGNTLHYFDN
ncbi:hypothetical protein [Dyadobacter arcticus]|uniref:Uncharacterized protein n=1 Tax=Dyadobacter arcticus TaxID=1078754 RepID=A0ABX0UH42_9BACT|nr:hypothetical protein [Dyadobacter arcticus]NIJ51823.1 hypothetical protein [Dyadobacter arcticus]